MFKRKMNRHYQSWYHPPLGHTIMYDRRGQMFGVVWFLEYMQYNKYGKYNKYGLHYYRKTVKMPHVSPDITTGQFVHIFILKSVTCTLASLASSVLLI